ncbi:MAG: hypothetical protein WC509_01820 [Candidatus Izemoplasmatales bacterium]
MDITYNDATLKQEARQPLLGGGVMTFGIATWILHIVVYLVSTIVTLAMPRTNPSYVLILILSVMSILSFVSILLAVIRTVWIAVDLGRTGDIPRYAIILFVVLSILPTAFGLTSSIASILHYSLNVGSDAWYPPFSSAISTMTLVTTILLPAGVGAYLLARSIKGGRRELAIAAIVIVQRLLHAILVERFPVTVYNPVINLLAFVFAAVAAAIHISILSDLAKSDWRRARKSSAAV